jgi:hypothetical protein
MPDRQRLHCDRSSHYLNGGGWWPPLAERVLTGA